MRLFNVVRLIMIERVNAVRAGQPVHADLSISEFVEIDHASLDARTADVHAEAEGCSHPRGSLRTRFSDAFPGG